MRANWRCPQHEEQVLKAGIPLICSMRVAHSVTERAAYIGRIRNLSRKVAQAYYESREALGFPMRPEPIEFVA